MSAILIGDTKEVLKNYFQRFHEEYARRLLGYFTGAEKSMTVREWAQGKYMPRGEFLLRVRCFLDFVGYRLTEFDELPETSKHFARLIAFNVLSIEDARIALGYTDHQQLYTMLLRGTAPRRERAFKVHQIVDANLARLQQQVDVWRPLIGELKALPPDGPMPADTLLSQRSKLRAEDLQGVPLARPEVTVAAVSPEPPSGHGSGSTSFASDLPAEDNAVTAFCYVLLALDGLVPYMETIPNVERLVRNYVPAERLKSVIEFMDSLV